MKMLRLESALMLLTVFALYFHASQAHNSPKDYVDTHNIFRAQVGVGPIAWNDTVAAYAQNYANKRAADCMLEHSYGPYGESITTGGEPFSGSDAVKFFASEKPFYDPKLKKCVKEECRHYTQVVARDTVHLGCARVKCKNGGLFIICNYDPPCGEPPY